MSDFNFGVENFGGYFKCKGSGNIVESICNDFTYTFHPGVYVLTGEFDVGGWALAYTLTGEYKKQILHDETKFFLNGKEVELKEISSHVKYLSLTKKMRPFIDTINHNTIKKQVENGIRQNNLPYSVDKIMEMFCFDESRFSRNIYYVSNRVYWGNAAIGFVNNKKIFCFPFLTRYEMRRNVIFPFVCNVLKEHGCIILVPTYESSWIKNVDFTEINIHETYMKKVCERDRQEYERQVEECKRKGLEPPEKRSFDYRDYI